MRQIERGDTPLGKRMRELRSKYKGRQDHVAHAMHVHPDKLRRFEHGNQMPTHQELQEFGRVLQLPRNESDELFRLAMRAAGGGPVHQTEPALAPEEKLWQPDDEHRFIEVLATPFLNVGELKLNTKLLPRSLWNDSRQQSMFVDDPEESRDDGLGIALEWTSAVLPENLLANLVQEIKEQLDQAAWGHITLSEGKKRDLEEVYRRLTTEGSNPYPRPVALPRIITRGRSGRGRTLQILLGQGKFGISLVAEKKLELPTAQALRSQHVLQSLALRVAYVFDHDSKRWVECHQREEHGNATWKGAWDVGAAGYVDPLNHRDPRNSERLSPWQASVDELTKELNIPAYELPHRDHYKFFGLARDEPTGHIILLGYCHGSFVPDANRRPMALVKAYDRCRLTPEDVADFIRAKQRWVPSALLTFILTLQAFRFSKKRIEDAFSPLVNQINLEA